jgi:hypothetical protein
MEPQPMFATATQLPRAGWRGGPGSAPRFRSPQITPVTAERAAAPAAIYGGEISCALPKVVFAAPAYQRVAPRREALCPLDVESAPGTPLTVPPASANGCFRIRKPDSSRATRGVLLMTRCGHPAVTRVV